MDEIRALAEAGKLSEILLPSGDGLALPQITLTDDQMQHLVTCDHFDQRTGAGSSAQRPLGKLTTVVLL